MNAFPAEDWFHAFGAYLEGDPDFVRHGRWFAATIGFRTGQQTVTMRLDRGMVLDVRPGYEDPDYLISGSRDQWSYLFERKWGLVRLYRSQTLAVRGDPVRLMQNWKPIFFIVEAMKRFEERV